VDEGVMSDMNPAAKAILEAADITIANVMVREWGNIKVRLKSWTAADRCDFDVESSAIEATLGEEEAGRLLIPRAVAWSVVDDDGAWAFARVGGKAVRKLATADKVKEACAHYEAVAGKNSVGLMRLWRVVSRLNGLTDEDEEDLEKN
jgi:hypothetical protein